MSKQNSKGQKVSLTGDSVQENGTAAEVETVPESVDVDTTLPERIPGTGRRGTLEILANIESQPLTNLEPSTEGLIVTSDHDISTDAPDLERRRQSSFIKGPPPRISIASTSPEAPQNIESEKRGSIFDKVKAFFRRSSSKSAAVSKPQPILASNITNSDFDLAFGRPAALRGTYFDIQWWWSKVAGGRHRSIIISLALLMALTILHIVAGIILCSTELKTEDPYLCTTEGCNIMAERILENLNTGVNPCENFYGFVCGDFHEKKNLKKSMVENSWSLNADSIKFSYKDSKALGTMLKANLKKKFPYNQLLPFYKACMDKRQRDKAGLGSYKQLLENYHLIELDPVKNGNSIEKILADLYRDNILTRPLFAIELDLKLKEYRLQRPTHSGMLKALKSGLADYRIAMKAMLDHVNPKLGLESTPDELIELLICFEYVLLHDVTETPWETYLGSMGSCNFGAISSTHPRVNKLKIENFFEYLFASRLLDISRWKAADMSRRSKDSLDYERILMGLMTQVDFGFVVRFLRWETLREYAGELDTETTSKDCAINKYSGRCRPIASCFWSMFKVMPFLASVSFIESLEKMKNFNAEVDLMLQSILNSTLDVVKLSRNERTRFLGTFSRIVEDVFRRVKVVYPVRLAEKYGASHVNDLGAIFKGLKMGKNHLKNILAIRHVEGRTLMKAHLKVKTNYSWALRPKYQIEILSKNLKNNLLTVPVGSLEPPFFQSTFPALDVAANGFIVAQSLSRMVFHDYFLRLQYSRTREKTFIGSGMSYSVFLGHVLLPYQKLLLETSRSLQIDLSPSLWKLEGQAFAPPDAVPYNMYVNQLADQFALKVAHIAHENYNKSRPRFAKQKLKGLEKYSPQQIFFISLANFKCHKYPKAQLSHMKKFGPIPDPISVNLLAANSEEFSETFQCPLGSARMNPVKKVNLYVE